jgi:predicted nucleic acid-binding protein
MVVVSDTSPLLNLAAIGEAQLLEKLFGTVVAPIAVANEIERLRRRDPRFASTNIGATTSFASARDRDRVTWLSLFLDPGEAEAIALALEMKADLLLVDERRATRTARRLSLKTLGLLGVLLLAKRKSHLVQVRPLLQRLEDDAGFWIGHSVRVQFLNAAGE